MPQQKVHIKIPWALYAKWLIFGIKIKFRNTRAYRRGDLKKRENSTCLNTYSLIPYFIFTVTFVLSKLTLEIFKHLSNTGVRVTLEITEVLLWKKRVYLKKISAMNCSNLL